MKISLNFSRFSSELLIWNASTCLTMLLKKKLLVQSMHFPFVKKLFFKLSPSALNFDAMIQVERREEALKRFLKHSQKLLGTIIFLWCPVYIICASIWCYTCQQNETYLTHSGLSPSWDVLPNAMSYKKQWNN